ncbi:putative inosine uridine-preferring nucleoside hydrolase protein [Neofusicoccum parvum UCRNP2]|uniref:Putative inosine uridine-preferring nucleoside hydrolase protein n=1 Tax=Botryosphaeria parva (strain UCR-NP2) TaxID=1287680 RepID=R1GHI6_BOTPV|nr:putative inosine uridine-preferring nucleoside hydrolase protein [Neofusicoccum parvum UCRNP2]
MLPACLLQLSHAVAAALHPVLLMDSLVSPRRLLRLALAALPLASQAHAKKSLIVDTDLFSDVDDAGALLLAATSPNVNLLAVNVNYPSSYSALAASAIVAHYGHPDLPIGIVRPLTNDSFFDDFYFELGEYASKVSYHWSDGSLEWGNASQAWDPVTLYRKLLSSQEDGSVTIASIGFFDNLSGLLNSTADAFSNSSGVDLVVNKVSELVVMGGGYPSGYEYNFWGSNSSLTAHVVNNWPGKITFSGSELGGNVTSGAPLTVRGPSNDPVAAAYRWYTGYNASRFSWDPLTVLYACQGLGDLFEYGNEFGYNYVHPNGSNDWVYDRNVTDQHWLQLKVDNETAARELDRLFLEGAASAA